MAGQNGKKHTTHQTLVVTLVLGCLLPSLTCFNLKQASNSVEHNKAVGVAATLEVRTRSIIDNGKDIKSQSVFAAQNHGPTYVDSYHLDGTGVFEWTSELEDPTASVLRQMNASLHCGENTMTLKATGPRAADLELEMGDAQPMLLTELPETCGHSVQQNEQLLIVVVSTMGCNVIKENGNHVLSIRWLDIPLNLTCPIYPTPEAQSALATSNPAKKPGEPNYSEEPSNMDARKRRHIGYYGLYGHGNPMYRIPASPGARPYQMTPFAYNFPYYRPSYSYNPFYHRYFQSLNRRPSFPTTAASGSTSASMMPRHPCNPYPPPGHPFPAMYYYEVLRRCYGQPYEGPFPPIFTTEPNTRRPGPPTLTITTTPTTAETPKPCKFFHSAGDRRIVKPYEMYQDQPLDLSLSEKFNHADEDQRIP